MFPKATFTNADNTNIKENYTVSFSARQKKKGTTAWEFWEIWAQLFKTNDVVS